jgi:hypothetical protein
MNTTGEIQTTLKRQLQMVSTSIVFADASLQDEIKNAYLWCVDMYPFPVLEKSSYTTAVGDYYFDLPGQYKSDSLTMVVIDDLEYKLIDFHDWLRYRREHPSNSDVRLAACYGRQYFITPTPASGKVVYIWGIIQADPLSFPDGETAFSGSEATGNEAIMRKAKSNLLASKGKQTEADKEEARAKDILATLWDNIIERKANFQRKDAPFFDVPDFFPGNGPHSTNTGNFSNRS